MLHCAALPIQLTILLTTLAVFFLKLGKLDKEVIVTGRESQILGPSLVKNCEFFQISPAMMRVIIIGCSGGTCIVMNLTVEKQWKQQVFIISRLNISLAVSNMLI